MGTRELARHYAGHAGVTASRVVPTHELDTATRDRETRDFLELSAVAAIEPTWGAYARDGISIATAEARSETSTQPPVQHAIVNPLPEARAMPVEATTQMIAEQLKPNMGAQC